MKKYINLLKYEMNNLLRDKMNLTMILYPFLMLIMSVWLFPMLLEIEGASGQGMEITMVIVIMAFLGMGYIIGSALLGFSLLDNKDEKTLQTIAVTPLAKDGYIKFKIIYTYIIGVVSTIIIFSGTKLFAVDSYVLETLNGTVRLFDNITHLEILVMALVSSLLIPFLALTIVGLSKSKIEGFAYMKASGLLMLIPMLVLLEVFRGTGQYFLSLVPNFWATQGVIIKMLPFMFESGANIGYYGYMGIGAILCLTYSVVAYKIFMKQAS